MGYVRTGEWHKAREKVRARVPRSLRACAWFDEWQGVSVNASVRSGIWSPGARPSRCRRSCQRRSAGSRLRYKGGVCWVKAGRRVGGTRRRQRRPGRAPAARDCNEGRFARRAFGPPRRGPGVTGADGPMSPVMGLLTGDDDQVLAVHRRHHGLHVLGDALDLLDDVELLHLRGVKFAVARGRRGVSAGQGTSRVGGRPAFARAARRGPRRASRVCVGGVPA